MTGGRRPDIRVTALDRFRRWTVGLNASKQADAKMNLAAFQHGQRVGATRLDQLHLHVGIALGVLGQECRKNFSICTGEAATFSTPVSPRRSNCACSLSELALPNRLRQLPSNCSPSPVRKRRRPTRSKSLRPSSCSRSLICREREGCAMRRCSAALETVPCSATVTKVRRCLRSMPLLISTPNRKVEDLCIGQQKPAGKSSAHGMPQHVGGQYATDLPDVAGHALPRNHGRRSAGLSVSPDHDDRAVPRRWTDGHARAHHGRAHEGVARSAGHHRERPGASGSIGTGRVARAAADGYTLGLGNWPTHVINGAVFTLQYDVRNDFEPVSLLATDPMVIVAKKSCRRTI